MIKTKLQEKLANIDKLSVLFVSVLICSFIGRMYRISAPISNDLYHSFRTSETAIVIQNFFREGFSFLHSSMPVFGKPWTVMFEFPTYQAIVYAVMKLFRASNVDLCGRIISVVSFYISTWYLVKLVRLLINKQVAYCVGILYMISLYNVYWSRAVLIDYTSVIFSLMYIYYLYKWLSSPKKKIIYYVVGLICGTLGYITKATSMFVVVFFIAFLIIEHEVRIILQYNVPSIFRKVEIYLKENIHRLIFLGVISIVPVIFGYVWTSHADAMKSLSVYTEWLTSENLHSWNYGTIQQKTSISNWNVIFQRYLAFFGGDFVLVCSIICYFIVSKKKYVKFIIFSTMAQILTAFSLFNLFYVHNYYLITLTPFVYMSFGIMLYEVFDELDVRIACNQIIVILICASLMYSQVKVNGDYLSGVKDISMENTNVGKFINGITNEDEFILITDEDWSPLTLYNADRKGFMVKNTELFDDVDFKTFIMEDNYTTLETHNVSTANNFLKIYSELEQFPIDNDGSVSNSESIYVYKFVDNIKSDIDNDDNLIIDTEEFYDLDLFNTDNAITFCYGIDYNAVLDTVVVDKEGITHNCKITLLKDTEKIKVNFSGICNNIDKIQIKLGDLENVEIYY